MNAPPAPHQDNPDGVRFLPALGTRVAVASHKRLGNLPAVGQLVNANTCKYGSIAQIQNDLQIFFDFSEFPVC